MMDQKLNKRRIPSVAMRAKLIAKHNNQCAMCTISGEEIPLELASITPFNEGGSMTEENFLLLCPNCHRYMTMGPKEIEFVNFLYQVIKETSPDQKIQLEAIIGESQRARADILIEDSRNAKILIECKSNKAITRSHSSKIVEQILEYGKLIGECKKVLAIPGRLPNEIKQNIESNDIEVWDADYLIKNFKAGIQKADSSYFKMLLTAITGEKKAVEVKICLAS